MDTVISPVVAERYEQCMAIFEDSGQRSVASTMEMWNALLEIYSRKLWRARFNMQEEWLEYIAELGYTGLSRSNVMFKLQRMKLLMSSGVKQEIAAAAVTAVPGAILKIGSAAEFNAVVKDGDPNEYVLQLAQLPPGEAIQRVRLDKGNTVEMWFSELRQSGRPGEVLGVIVRSDGKRGYTAYDVKVSITPQVPGNQDLLDPVSAWAVNRIGGHSGRSARR